MGLLIVKHPAIDSMEIFDALPKEIRDFLSYSDYGFSYDEINTIARQYANGVFGNKEIIESMRRYADRKRLTFR